MSEKSITEYQELIKKIEAGCTSLESGTKVYGGAREVGRIMIDLLKLQKNIIERASKESSKLARIAICIAIASFFLAMVATGTAILYKSG